MTSRLGSLTATLIVVAALIAACGGEDDAVSPTAAPSATTPARANAASPATEPSPPPASPTATATVTQLASPTPTAEPTATETPSVPIGERGNAEIYVMNADGSEQHRLTNMLSLDVYPAWSPDGTKIAFVSFNGTGSGLYVMDADGANLIQVSDAATTRPVWSPDGRQILVVSGHGYDGDYPQIYLVEVDGSGQRRLTNVENVPTANLSMGNVDPAWSPDGSRIAFVALQSDGPSEVHVMDSDGTNVQRLTDSPLRKTNPVWSPDGSQIAYWTDEGDVDIWVMDADGSDQRNLTAHPATEIIPAWSPVGQSIAFIRVTDTGNQIMLVNPDGSDLRSIADLESVIERIVWAPDGTRIAFSPYDPSGNRSIYTINASGDLEQVTDAENSDGDPAWSPDGSKIAFVSLRDGGQPVHCSWSAHDDLIAVASVEALTWMARMIVAGTVVEEFGPAFGGPGHRDMDGARTIYTDYIIEVDQQYRGSPVDRLQLRVTGGTIGDCVQTVDPTVNLTQGMRVMLFLFDEHVDGDLPPAYLVSVIGAWTVGDDGTLASPDPTANPVGIDGLTVEAVGAMVTDALAGAPSPDAYWVVPLEESPATPQ